MLKYVISRLLVTLPMVLVVISLTWALIRLAAPFMPMWRELLVMRYLWQQPHALDDAGLRALIGSVPQTPLPQALRSALVELELLIGTGEVPARA